jgi:CBS domain-containing protein
MDPQALQGGESAVRVAMVMDRNVASARPFDGLVEAARAMHFAGKGCLPIVADDGSERVIGMLHDRDVTAAVAGDVNALAGVEVRSAMRATPVCTSDDALRDALAAMRENDTCCLPVVDSRTRLLGVVSVAGIARAVEAGSADAASSRDVCRVLAESSRRRDLGRALGDRCEGSDTAAAEASASVRARRAARREKWTSAT